MKVRTIAFATFGIFCVLALFAVSEPVGATNYPCSKTKGGVERCEGTKFLCRDGSVSASKKKCTSEKAKDFRREWDTDNGREIQEPEQTEEPEQQDQGSLIARPLLLLASASPKPLVRVIDGDTLEVDGTTFRLEGIDAPEMKQPCSDESGKTYACGRRAKEALSAMISDAVTCEMSGTDKYGRKLGYCRSGEIDLNRQMVARGWAFAFTRYNDRYVEDEQRAISARAGLWAGSAQAPWDWRAAQIAALAPKGDCVIKGNISKGQRTYYLPFHLMYARVKVDENAGERWFCTEQEAIDAGWRRAPR
jgi:endonuclease YncB( thermonuclease family)